MKVMPEPMLTAAMSCTAQPQMMDATPAMLPIVLQSATERQLEETEFTNRQGRLTAYEPRRKVAPARRAVLVRPEVEPAGRRRSRGEFAERKGDEHDEERDDGPLEMCAGRQRR